MDKFTTATTWTNLIYADFTYSSGATLRVITYHSDASTLKVRVYYNNALIGTEQTVTDAGIISNNKHGLFSTYSGNSLDNFTLFPRGSSTTKFTSAPFEELTPTRDTTTKYAGTASAKLVAGGTDANYLQSVNVGDTSTYTLTAYAYTDGSAVTTADLDLYYDTAVLSTTFTSVGSGWYRLTGTLTGVASAKNYGVRVHAGKTVYVDSLSLNDYTNGTLTSSIFGAGYTATYGTLTYSATTPSGTSVSVKVRSGSSSDLSDATAFSSCSAISSGSSISGNACASSATRYAQYQVTLTSTTGVSTPTFSSFSAAFSDATAPSTGSISINSGATYSASRSVTLTLSTTDNLDSGSSLSMMIANDSGFSGGAWETYATSKSWTLASGDGTQTVYVKFKDSSGNTGSTYSDTIILDTTGPTAPTLSTPSDGTYTNSTQPSFTFSGGSTDATSGFDHYTASISKSSATCSSGQTCSYSFGTVTASAGFSMSGISKSLTEGTWNWSVTAYDALGNTTSSSRMLYIDLSSPSLTATLDNQGTKDDYYLVNTQSPKISGTVTDNMYISGVTVSFYKEKTLLGVVFSEDLVDQETLGKPTSTTSTSWDYSFTTSKQLDHGKYRVTIKATDAAGNSSGDKEWETQILPQEKINLLLLEAGEKPEKETTGPFSIPELEKKAIVRREMEAANLAQLTSQITDFLSKYLGIPITNFFGDLSVRIAYFTKTVRGNLAAIQIPSYKFQTPNKLKIQMPKIPNMPDMGPIAQKSAQAAEIINKPFNSLAKSSGLAVRQSTRALALAIIGTGNTISNLNNNIINTYNYQQKKMEDKVADIWQGQKLSEALELSIQEIQKPVVATTNLLGRIRMGLATAYAIIIDKQPTRITEVSIVEVGGDYAIVDFKTNHPALGKINYGETLAYGKNLLFNEYSYDHKVKLTGLTPGKLYFFEVMAQNKNYAYDAYYTIKIPD